ncbi:MAG: GEVED domain-containing protein, partial [Planctomycetota bacterium]
LGTLLDIEAEGSNSADARADNSSGEEDEDGVIPLSSFVAHPTSPTTATVVVSASSDSRLDAWIDFNQDGDWDDEGEQIFTSEFVLGGVNQLPLSVPAGASTGNTFARFRLSSLGGLSPTGPAADGEVEDYQVEILNGSQPSVATINLISSTSIQAEEEGEDIVIRDGQSILFQAPLANLRVDVNASNGSDHLTLASIGLLLNEKLRFNGSDGEDSVRLPNVAEDIDLGSLPSAALTSIEQIIVDAGPGVVTISDAAVAAMTDAPHRLSIQQNGEAQIAFADGWQVNTPQISGGSFVHLLSHDSSTIELQNARQHQNPDNPLDTDFSGSVSAIDALLLIAGLNEGGGALASLESIPNDFFYADVSGDDFLSAIDALLAIDFLNTRVDGEAEGEASGYCWTEKEENQLSSEPMQIEPENLLGVHKTTRLMLETDSTYGPQQLSSLIGPELDARAKEQTVPQDTDFDQALLSLEF